MKRHIFQEDIIALEKPLRSHAETVNVAAAVWALVERILIEIFELYFHVRVQVPVDPKFKSIAFTTLLDQKRVVQCQV